MNEDTTSQQARETAWYEWWLPPARQSQSFEPSLPDVFDAGFDAGAAWQSSQQTLAIQTASQGQAQYDRELWVAPLRAALQACVEALETQQGHRHYLKGCECLVCEALAQAKALLEAGRP